MAPGSLSERGCDVELHKDVVSEGRARAALLKNARARVPRGRVRALVVDASVHVQKTSLLVRTAQFPRRTSLDPPVSGIKERVLRCSMDGVIL